VHTKKAQKVVIDGERKAILTRVDVGNFSYSGLLRRSAWATKKASPGTVIVTARALMSMTLDLPGLDGQLPPIGTLIPADLVQGKSGVKRSGAAMALHLKTIETNRKADLADAKRFRAIKASIVG
jgi:hypothetical protein